MNNAETPVPPPFDGFADDSPEGRQVALLAVEVPVELIHNRWPSGEDDDEVFNRRARQLVPELRRRLNAMPELEDAIAESVLLLEFLDSLATLLEAGHLSRRGYIGSVELLRSHILEWIDRSKGEGEVPVLNRLRDTIFDWRDDWPEPQELSS